MYFVKKYLTKLQSKMSLIKEERTQCTVSEIFTLKTNLSFCSVENATNLASYYHLQP